MQIASGRPRYSAASATPVYLTLTLTLTLTLKSTLMIPLPHGCLVTVQFNPVLVIKHSLALSHVLPCTVYTGHTNALVPLLCSSPLVPVVAASPTSPLQQLSSSCTAALNGYNTVSPFRPSLSCATPSKLFSMYPTASTMTIHLTLTPTLVLTLALTLTLSLSLTTILNTPLFATGSGQHLP